MDTLPNYPSLPNAGQHSLAEQVTSAVRSNNRWLSMAEHTTEAVLFNSRWVLAPFYLGLALSLVVLLVKFAMHGWELLAHALLASRDEVVVGVLGLIDVSLMGNLLVMVILAGYENFVGRMKRIGDDRPNWMGRVSFGDLKCKLMTSIVAISAIHTLEAFMHLHSLSDRDLGWTVGIHMAFIVSTLFLGLMDRFCHK